MTFLPVAERELRVAARKRSTFRVRVIAALVAWIIGSGVLVLSRVGPGFGTPSLGKGLFGVLTWLSLAVALSAGLFLSAISRESQKALAATLFLLLLLVAAGPASDGIFAAIKQRAFKPMISLSSPGYLFVTAGAWGRTPFWAALLVNQAVAWTFFDLGFLLL